MWFSKHLKDKNETYFEHGLVALRCSMHLAYLSMAALVHAFFPFLCEKTVSEGLKRAQCGIQRKDT